MSNLMGGYRQLMKNNCPDSSLLVPLLRWASASRENIELCQRINFLFYNTNRKINIRELSYTCIVRNFKRFPKTARNDKNLDFFYSDAARLLGWTKKELMNNLDVIDLSSLKEEVAVAYGYDNKSRKLLCLKPLLTGGKRWRKKVLEKQKSL